MHFVYAVFSLALVKQPKMFANNIVSRFQIHNYYKGND